MGRELKHKPPWSLGGRAVSRQVKPDFPVFWAWDLEIATPFWDLYHNDFPLEYRS